MAPRRVTLVFCGILIVLLLVPMLGAQPSQRRTALTQQQIERLIDLKSPDLMLAAEVSDRGLAFSLTHSILGSLRSRGAGPRTLQALSRFLSQARLTILTQPPAPFGSIRVAGSSYTADSEGRFVLTDLTPGSYNMTFRHERFQEQSYQIAVREGESTQEIRLQLARGWLTVMSRKGASRIEVEGLGSWTNEIRDLACEARVYRITVSEPYYLPWSKEVAVEPGQRTVITPDLVLDSTAVQLLELRAVEAIQTRNYHRAQDRASLLLELQPGAASALSMLATAQYYLNQHNKAIETGYRALQGGASIEFQVLHHHQAISMIHPASVRLTAKEFSFDPQVAHKSSCTFEAFRIPISLVESIQVTRSPRNEIFLTVRVRDSKNSNRVRTLNFAHHASKVTGKTAVPGAPRQQNIFSPADAPQSLGVIQKLITQAKTIQPN